jgi:NAD(P)-dependent dehydrogenase (short-subunit alcohol dehydrogenase family)
MGRLSGKSAIITGAGSGIGRASAVLFAREGARLVIADKNEAGLKETLGLVEDAKGEVDALVVDAGAEQDVKELVAHAAALYNGLDVMFANAGISGGWTGLLDHTSESFAEILRVNLIGPFLAIKYSAPHMIARANTAPSSAPPRWRACAPTPAARPTAPQGRRRQPGADLGQRLHRHGRARQRGLPRPDRDGHDEADLRFMRGRARNRRQDRSAQSAAAPGQPEEIAAMALFLASDEASYVNGQAFPVDGGLSSTLPFARPRA